MNVRPVEELTYSELKIELASILELIEGNTLELEESLRKYERGVAIVRELERRLDEAQQKVSFLMGEPAQKMDDEAQDTTLS